jgi:hypothetical protein
MAPLGEAAASVVERARELVVVIRLNGPERRLLRDSNRSEIRGKADLSSALKTSLMTPVADVE